MKIIDRIKQSGWYSSHGVSHTEMAIIVAIAIMVCVSGWQYFYSY